MTSPRDPGVLESLYRRYGRPERYSTALALRLFGLRGQIHPLDAYAWRYASVEAAEVFAARSRRYLIHTVHGPLITEVGPINLLDLRPWLIQHGAEPRDPVLPDDWREGHRP